MTLTSNGHNMRHTQQRSARKAPAKDTTCLLSKDAQIDNRNTSRMLEKHISRGEAAFAFRKVPHSGRWSTSTPDFWPPLTDLALLVNPGEISEVQACWAAGCQHLHKALHRLGASHAALAAATPCAFKLLTASSDPRPQGACHRSSYSCMRVDAASTSLMIFV